MLSKLSGSTSRTRMPKTTIAISQSTAMIEAATRGRTPLRSKRPSIIARARGDSGDPSIQRLFAAIDPCPAVAPAGPDHARQVGSPDRSRRGAVPDGARPVGDERLDLAAGR